MAQIMKDGPKRVLSQGMEQHWRSSEASTRMGDGTSASTLSPKAPLRSISHGNFRSIGMGSVTPAKRAISVVEEMETKQRENMSRKLKDLQLSSGRSPQPKHKFEMPTIFDTRLAKTAALSRSTLRRDSVANYQAVSPAAFGLRGGSSTASPRFSLKGPELFPLRASQSLTSLNRIYDRGFSVFASDDFNNYSTEKGLTENGTGTGSVLLRPSLSSSVCGEFPADTYLAREIKPAEEKAVENAIDNIFKDTKAKSLTGHMQPASDKQRSKQDGSLTLGNSPSAGPPLNLNTYPKPQIPPKSADLKMFKSKEEKSKNSSVGNAEQNDSRAGSSFPVQAAATASTPRSHHILGDSNHSRTYAGIAKDTTSLTVDQQLETSEKTDHPAKNYNNADIYRRSQHHQEDDENCQDTRSVPQPPKPSFKAGLQVDVNQRDLLIPSTSDPEVSNFTSRASTRLGAVPGSRIGLQSIATPYNIVSHQKMDSLLSDCNTVDSGIGRSEAAGSPGSLYQDSADELDNKGYTGWTAPTADSFTEGRANHQQQQSKRQTKKEFVSTAAISLSPQVTETSKVNYVGVKPTNKGKSSIVAMSPHLKS